MQFIFGEDKTTIKSLLDSRGYKSCKNDFVASIDGASKLRQENTSKRKIDKAHLTGLTPEKKEILKSLNGCASIPIDFNKMREEEKYGE